MTVIVDHDGGWYDTGDLAVLAGDVEAELRNHPEPPTWLLAGVPVEGEILDDALAVIVPSGPPPGLDELNAFLTARGMTDWCLPTRVIVVDALPREA